MRRIDDHPVDKNLTEEFPQFAGKAAVDRWILNHPDKIALLDVVRHAKPTVLIGACGQPGAFSRAIVRAMANTTPGR
jgi:malate dehydrogenase (oxaloacetate-decarboxylating)